MHGTLLKGTLWKLPWKLVLLVALAGKLNVERTFTRVLSIENRIYREELKESLGMVSVPFSLKGSSKCTNHVNVHKLYAVEYINTV